MALTESIFIMATDKNVKPAPHKIRFNKNSIGNKGKQSPYSISAPPIVKIATTHALKEYGYTHERIAELMGIGKGTVSKYMEEVGNQELIDQIKKSISYKENTLSLKVLSNLEKQVDEGKPRFFELTGLYKTLKDTGATGVKGTGNLNNFIVIRGEADKIEAKQIKTE